MHHIRLLAVLFSLLIAAVPCTTPQVPDAAAIMARIEGPQNPDRGGYDSYSLRDLMNRLGVPGVSIAIISDFKIHLAKAYGVADVSTGAAVDTETLFQAASISKPVAAMAVLRAVQDGRFSLDTNINGILTSGKIDRNRRAFTIIVHSK